MSNLRAIQGHPKLPLLLSLIQQVTDWPINVVSSAGISGNYPRNKYFIKTPRHTEFREKIEIPTLSLSTALLMNPKASRRAAFKMVDVCKSSDIFVKTSLRRF